MFSGIFCIYQDNSAFPYNCGFLWTVLSVKPQGFVFFIISGLENSKTKTQVQSLPGENLNDGTGAGERFTSMFEQILSSNDHTSKAVFTK